MNNCKAKNKHTNTESNAKGVCAVVRRPNVSQKQITVRRVSLCGHDSALLSIRGSNQASAFALA
jgi:hypothetical protein